jgi:hypothetical protein
MKQFRNTNYTVSECGKVYREGKEVSQSKMTRGYLSVGIWTQGISKTYYSHRVVAEIYIPNPENKPFVNHINGNKLDNRVENLEWVTAKENSQHSVTILRKEMGERHSRAQVPDRIVRYIKKCKLHSVEPDYPRIASTYGVKSDHIKRIYRGHKRKIA